VAFVLLSCSCHPALSLSPFGGNNLDKGFNILETASKLIPQGQIVNTAKESWKFAWRRMMAELAPQDKNGSYSRPSYTFEGRIGDKTFPDEHGRYHLFVGNPCPWCHRARLVVSIRKFTGQEIGVTQLVDDPVKASRGGWIFGPSSPDPISRSKDLRELYEFLSPNYEGRCTAPLLVDRKKNKIVSNESADIVRMLELANFGRDGNGGDNGPLYPPELASVIDETNSWIYEKLNNGVYRCGFATQQGAYDRASSDVREGLHRANEILSRQSFLCGEQFTEADIRFLPTALRFDGVYAPLFKAGGAHVRIRDFQNIHAWLKRCWEIEGVKESIDLKDANESYYKQLFPLNPGGIIPTSVSAEEIGLK